MRVLFREGFLRDVEALNDSALKKRVRKAIVQVEQATALKDIGNLKKLKGGDQYYRIRIGDYRLGLVLEENSVVFTRCLHRKDIYRYFP
jgi:mRNA interferase RelE/StbE